MSAARHAAAADQRLALPDHVAQHASADAAATAAALAARVGAQLRSALAGQDAATLVVSGGRSPLAFLAALSCERLPWDRVMVTLADERWLPADAADANAGLVRTALLQNEAAAATFVPLYGGEPTPEAGAAACAARLARLPRPFAAVVLGMGEDGHTASLFPGSAALPTLLAADAPAVAAVHPPAAPHPRISLGLPLLLDARTVFVQIGGPEKRAVLQRAAAADPLQMPIAAVLAQRHTPVEVFYDTAA